MSESFSDYVFIGSLSELGFKLEEKYKEKFDNNSYTLKSRPFDSKYFTALDQTKFVQSTVSKDNKDIVDDGVRSSKIYKKCNIEVRSSCTYDYYNRKINTTKVKPLKNSLECSFAYEFDLIKYEEGDHFNEFHYDTFKNGNVATLLIFYPSEYTGGDLVFKIDDVEHIIKTDEFKEITCVIFGKVLHKCTQITSGIRYVFKGSIKASLPNILSVNNRFTIDEIDKIDKINNVSTVEINYDDEIEEQKKIIEDLIDSYYNAKIAYAKANLPSKLNHINNKNNINNKDNDDEDNKNDDSDYIKALRKLKCLESCKSDHRIRFNLDGKKYNICVLPYYIESMNDIMKYQQSTLDYIKQLILAGWNVTAMYETFNFKTDFEEGWRKLEGTQFYGSASGRNYDDYDGTGYNGKYILHYDTSDVEGGKCLDFHSEYNDQSGDDIYEEYECSCLLVWKE